MPSTTLYLVRHAEADRHDEADDPGLSQLGRKQAAAVGARLRGTEFSALHHSSRRRAVETANIIAEGFPRTPVVRSDLAEDRTPIPEDWSEVPQRYHDFLRNAPADGRDPGARRLNGAIAELGQIGETDRSILVVTHNFVIGWFVRHALDAPVWRWISLNQAPAGVSVIRWDPDHPPRLLAFNDVGHLSEL